MATPCSAQLSARALSPAPMARYGPFVMTTREELVQEVRDFHAGRMGVIPPEASRT